MNVAFTGFSTQAARLKKRRCLEHGRRDALAVDGQTALEYEVEQQHVDFAQPAQGFNSVVNMNALPSPMPRRTFVSSLLAS
jgi:hypothetical protein